MTYDSTRQFPDRRDFAHTNTRAAVDLVSNFGVVMQEVVELLDEDTILDMTAGPESADRLRWIRDALTDALHDDQAVRAAFLEHFPHLCAKKTTKKPERGGVESHD